MSTTLELLTEELKTQSREVDLGPLNQSVSALVGSLEALRAEILGALQELPRVETPSPPPAAPEVDLSALGELEQSISGLQEAIALNAPGSLPPVEMEVTGYNRQGRIKTVRVVPETH